MKTLAFLLALTMGVSISANAVEKVRDADVADSLNFEQMTKKERKAYEKMLEKQRDSVAHAEALNAVKDGSYILLVDRTRWRKLTLAERGLNFFIVKNGQVVLQTGSAGASTGSNRLGGYTGTSKIVGGVKIEEKKNGKLRSTFKVVNPFLSGNVFVELDDDSNYGEVGIQYAKGGRRGRGYDYLMGFILPYDDELVETLKVGKLHRQNTSINMKDLK